MHGFLYLSIRPTIFREYFNIPVRSPFHAGFVQNVPAFEVQVGIEKGSKEIQFNPQLSYKEWIGQLHQQ